MLDVSCKTQITKFGIVNIPGVIIIEITYYIITKMIVHTSIDVVLHVH